MTVGSSRLAIVAIGALNERAISRGQSGAYASLSEAVQAVLRGIYDNIADQPRHEVADRYLDLTETICRSLENFPERGNRRDDLFPDCGQSGSNGSRSSPSC